MNIIRVTVKQKKMQYVHNMPDFKVHEQDFASSSACERDARATLSTSERLIKRNYNDDSEIVFKQPRTSVYRASPRNQAYLARPD